MNRIDKRFKELKRENKKAFIAFITAGYPDLGTTEKLIIEFSKIGVDIVEIGVPFSDPMADGPVIQESSQWALKKGVNLKTILGLIKRVRQKTEIPICVMTYYNPIFCYGDRKFIKDAKAAGLDGIIIPDLPPEEAGELISLSRAANLDTVFFISPTTSLERVRIINSVSRGFVYYVSTTGVTGLRKRLPDDLTANIKSAKKNTSRPICVGFGVSNNKQVKQIYRIADGVIVGSAIVKKIRDNIGKPDLIKKVSNFVARLKA